MSRRDHGSPALSVALAGSVIAAAILLPVFTNRHPSGRIQSCLSHERLLGMALTQYAQDSDEQLPEGTQGGGEGWGGQVFPYVRDTRVYHCDDNSTADTASTLAVSYGFNSNCAEEPRLSEYAAPGRTVLLFEVTRATANVAVRDEGMAQGAASFSAAGDGTEGTLLSGRGDVRYATGLLGGRMAAEFTQFDPPRHKNGANFLLADGHARWLAPEDVSGGRTAARPAAPQMGARRDPPPARPQRLRGHVQREVRAQALVRAWHAKPLPPSRSLGTLSLCPCELLPGRLRPSVAAARARRRPRLPHQAAAARAWGEAQERAGHYDAAAEAYEREAMLRRATGDPQGAEVEQRRARRLETDLALAVPGPVLPTRRLAKWEPAAGCYLESWTATAAAPTTSSSARAVPSPSPTSMMPTGGPSPDAGRGVRPTGAAPSRSPGSRTTSTPSGTTTTWNGGPMTPREGLPIFLRFGGR